MTDPAPIKVDVKLIKPESKVKEVKKKVAIPQIRPSEKHSGAKVIPVKSPKPGLITIVALDKEGKEKGSEFNVPEKEYNKYYSDETKFKFKKKAI